MGAFLDKQFNRSLSEEESVAIMQDFPKSNSDVLVVLRQCLTCNLVGAQANCTGKAEPEVESPCN